MIIKIGKFEYTEVWDGIFYKKLSNYPYISDWEMRTLIEFVQYEKKYGRECTIECEDSHLLQFVKGRIKNENAYRNVLRPKLLTECTACRYRKGCETEYVCHTTSKENAIKILKSGKLLSARRARNVSVKELMNENRNAANDPADYFEYIMFTWGNCQGGDRLVMERSLGHFPDEEDLSIRFKPGIRFYFQYDKLVKHPNRIFDGVLPMKVKDEIVLSEWVYKIVVPQEEENELAKYIPHNLIDKVVYVKNDCKDIWDWSEKIYRLIEGER